MMIGVVQVKWDKVTDENTKDFYNIRKTLTAMPPKPLDEQV